MKLPSIGFLKQSLLETCRRFPFVLVSALLGTIVILFLFHVKSFPDDIGDILIRTAMVCALGLPLFFAVHIFCERVQPLMLYKFLIFLVAVNLLVQFYFLLGNMKTEHGESYYRYFFWSAGFHLLAAFSGFYMYEEINGFWQFNKVLFLRFLTSGLYAAVLYMGLACALLAVQELFGVEINGKVYADLYVVIAGLFNTVFFLGGVTKPLEDLNTDTSYPKGLKVFTQYVLIPLVTIYLLILYAYTLKILVQMNLPKGWVANLIIGFSVAGIFSLLLVYPIREQVENKWLKAFSRFYYFSLLPLIVLLFVAIGTRISAYGVTLERYMVAMLGVWLAVITLYFVFSKQKNIILIPVTLCLFFFGSIIGPWGIFQVSERSQLKRLYTLLEKNEAIVNGKVHLLSQQKAQQVKIKDVNQVNSILEYLGNNHGFAGMTDWFENDCGKKIFTDTLNKDGTAQQYEIQKCIGIYGYNYSRYENANEEKVSINYYCNQFQEVEGLSVSGYDRIFNVSASEYYKGAYEDSNADRHTHLEGNRLSVYRKSTLLCAVQLDSVANSFRNMPRQSNYVSDLKPEQMTFEINNAANQKIKLLLSNFQLTITDTSLQINSLSGYMLLKDLK